MPGPIALVGFRAAQMKRITGSDWLTYKRTMTKTPYFLDPAISRVQIKKYEITLPLLFCKLQDAKWSGRGGDNVTGGYFFTATGKSCGKVSRLYDSLMTRHVPPKNVKTPDGNRDTGEAQLPFPPCPPAGCYGLVQGEILWEFGHSWSQNSICMSMRL